MSDVTSDNVGSPSDDRKGWRTGGRQPGLMKPCRGHPNYRLRIEALERPSQKKRRMVFSTEAGYDKAWATEAAALAARSDFKRWVEDGMGGSQQRVAQAAATAARTETAARDQARIPVRFSGRNRMQLRAPLVGLSLQVDRSGVAVVTISVTLPTEDLPTEDTLAIARWQQRSAQVVDRKKRCRDAAEAAAAAIPAVCWDDFFERCRKAAERLAAEPTTPAKQTPRGPSHAARISQRRRHVSHIARKEQQWAQQQESVAAAHAVRVVRIELLRNSLLSGNVASLLRPPPSEAEGSDAEALPLPISLAQASRVTTQGWAVVRFYEELDAIELGVLDRSRSVPKGGAKQAASAAGGAFVGVSAETVRGWAYDFEPVFGSSSCGFSRDQRGRWSHPTPLHPTPSHPTLPHAIPSHPAPPRPIPSHPIPSHPIPSDPIPSHPR